MKTLQGNNISGIALLGNQLNFDLSLLSQIDTIISALDADRGGFSVFIDITAELPGREYKAYDLKGFKDPNELLRMQNSVKRHLTAKQKLQSFTFTDEDDFNFRLGKFINISVDSILQI